MKKNPNIKWAGIVFYLFMQIIAFLYWRGLEQKNVETLFFPKGGLQGYQQFLANFEEQKLLLVKVKFSSEFGDAEYLNFKKSIEGLKEEYPDVEILTFYDLYHQALTQDNPQAFREFLKNKPDIALKLFTPDSLLFLSFFDQKSSSATVASFISKVQTEKYFVNQKVQMAGLPYINYLLDQYSRAINTQLFPILFLVVFLVTLFFTRNFLTSLVLFVPALGSLSLTMALIKGCYGSINMVTTIVPILIFVLNLSLALHFYYAFLEYGSMRRALREKYIPFLLMVSATAIGFGTLAISDIPAIHQFGVLSFPAIILNAAFTFLWAYSLFPWRLNKDDGHSVKWMITHPFSKTWRLATIVVVSLILIPSSFLFFPKIGINTDATSYFPKRSGLEKSIRDLENEVMGIPVVELDLSKKDKSSLEYEDILTFDLLENQISQEFGTHRKILSANQLVKEANYLYTGEKKLPPFDLSYWTLKGQTAFSIQNQYPKSDHYRLTLFSPSMNDQAYKAELTRIQKILDHFPQFTANFSGIYYQVMYSQSSLIWVLTASFILRFLVIAVLFYLYFRRIRLLIIFLLANELPVFACILFLYLFRFSLNVATVMVFPVAIGIVVGNTLHVIYALNKKTLPSFEEYFRTIVTPILIGSTTLIFGFSILGFYGFLPIQQFGAALAFTVFTGLFSALYLVPTLVLKSANLKEVLSVRQR